ncbi:hypothetical protein Sme01_04370 [Sphaerisporangium melleum]|uniref:Uncharacterized protein n=1 Tax=Sphaerisporangium melleum TaxID=321316 RepID=A0A917VBR9_9ACTN|nr:hypothetical protein GCM10007964_01920 [Sphaerisporangium melleum]GII67961.1 hypothetical protein Sme01_04370 [Sphaerisporangium melleum]
MCCLFRIAFSISRWDDTRRSGGARRVAGGCDLEAEVERKRNARDQERPGGDGTRARATAGGERRMGGPLAKGRRGGGVRVARIAGGDRQRDVVADITEGPP